MKTAELSGMALNWAVAKAEGITYAVWEGQVVDKFSNPLLYHDDWSLAGAIIEREGMGLWMYHWNEQGEPESGWYAEDKDGDHVHTGKTPLEAALRCYVASKLGDEVQVPEGVI